MIPVPRSASAPWDAVLTGPERSLVLYALVVAGLALLATFLRLWATRTTVGPKYRPASLAGVGVVAVAFTSYVLLAIEFLVGYDRSGSSWVPNDAAIWSWAPRYMDWSVSVPLLVVELLAVSALAGGLARRLRVVGVSAAFLMIALGYLGGVVVDGGHSFPALLGYGLASSVFFVVLYIVVIVTVVRSLPLLPPVARSPYRAAMVLLLGVWFVYPIVFGLQGFAHGGAWAVTGHLALAAADVTAKTGYGLLIQKVALLRTAADVTAGVDVQPEAIWVDQQQRSEAVAPPAATGLADAAGAPGPDR